MTEEIPLDILNLIDEIYTQKEFTGIKKADWNVYDEYYIDLKELFPAFEITNATDFNYNHGYEYDVLDKERNSCIGINISKIIRYYCIAYLGDSLDTPSNAPVIYGTPQSILHHEMKEKLDAFLRAKGYKSISLELSWQIIPGVETELKEEGRATVRDCIF